MKKIFIIFVILMCSWGMPVIAQEIDTKQSLKAGEALHLISKFHLSLRECVEEVNPAGLSLKYMGELGVDADSPFGSGWKEKPQNNKWKVFKITKIKLPEDKSFRTSWKDLINITLVSSEEANGVWCYQRVKIFFRVEAGDVKNLTKQEIALSKEIISTLLKKFKK